MEDLTGQIAVVTGASRGIGNAIALRLAQHGVTVCMVGRKLESLHAIVEANPDIACYLRCYLTDLEVMKDIHELAKQLQADHNHIDILVHSAGIISYNLITDSRIADFNHVYRTNVLAPYALTQALLPILKSHNGQVVFINSSIGLADGRAFLSQYSATKHALKAFADSLRDEVNVDGIRVLSVYPGRTAGAIQASLFASEGKEYHSELLMQPDDIASIVISALRLPRSAEVTDISIRPMHKF